jgi:hypothetical protein
MPARHELLLVALALLAASVVTYVSTEAYQARQLREGLTISVNKIKI